MPFSLEVIEMLNNIFLVFHPPPPPKCVRRLCSFPTELCQYSYQFLYQTTDYLEVGKYVFIFCS